MLRSFFMAIFLIFATVHMPAMANDKPDAILYKNPQCGCCSEYASYMRKNGYKVTVQETENLDQIKIQHGVQEGFMSCHTMLIDGYVVEGHVPLNALDKLLTERPKIKGISLPGMPQGTPGMPGIKEQPFTVYEISDKAPKVFSVE